MFVIAWDSMYYATRQPAGCWTTHRGWADRFATETDARAAAVAAGLQRYRVRPVPDDDGGPAESFREFCGTGPECIVCGRGRP